ncbi:MAG: DUF342 domain-containing protein [Deltaproteobacteria bacterium]|nr:DUF342 domain-containing protein [Deltaproteobacteria bacterium]
MAVNDNSKPKIPLIGLLAVKNLLITKEELQKGLATCPGGKDQDSSLKEYLLSNELISSQNMDRLLRAAKAFEIRQKEFKFGAIAIRKGFINQSVLKLALEEQEKDIKNKRKIRMVGDMLVEAGMLTEKQRDYILKLQKRVRKEIKKTPDKKINKHGPDDIKTSAETLENKLPENSDKDLENSREDAETLLEPEIITGGIKLEISKDLMAAFFSKTKNFDKNITVTQIKEALYEKGIVLGIAEDKMIEGFINSSGFKTKSFRIAKGILPIQGKDAKVEFFFNTDYLKAGGLTNDGAIDFKERGKIPHVEEGTVLAEKIPMVVARRGHNIFGDEIETIPGNDVVLKIGKGAKLSEDGYKVLADVKGFPKYALSGHIFVHQEYITQGDVDYETGHINYDGNVNIKGRIKSGFKVKGNDIEAIELDGGIVTADGNVKIAGGINEGKIYARGNVYAKFIHKSEVICMGDVIIQKEIVDSEVECSGNCVIENGKLISSRLTAKMGFKARNIGTERAEASIIKVGHDAFTEKELEKNKEKVDELKKQIEYHKEKKEKFKEENFILQKQITELAHVQDRSQLEEKEIYSKISLMENDAGKEETIKELKEKIELLKITVQKAEENLDICFDKSENIEAVMEQEDRKIEALGKRQKDFLDERSNLIAWAKDNPGQSVVIVEGAILPETVIFGRHSEKRVTELIRHSRITEILCTSDDGRSLNIYEMQVGNI